MECGHWLVVHHQNFNWKSVFIPDPLIKGDFSENLGNPPPQGNIVCMSNLISAQNDAALSAPYLSMNGV